MRVWIFLGGLNGFFSILAGSVGWMFVSGDSTALHIFMTGTQVQLLHAIALLAVAWQGSRRGTSNTHTTPGRRLVNLSGFSLFLGSLVLSVSLYVTALSGLPAMLYVGPFGVGLLLIGWAGMIALAFRKTRATDRLGNKTPLQPFFQSDYPPLQQDRRASRRVNAARP